MAYKTQASPRKRTAHQRDIDEAPSHLQPSATAKRQLRHFTQEKDKKKRPLNTKAHLLYPKQSPPNRSSHSKQPKLVRSKGNNSSKIPWWTKGGFSSAEEARIAFYDNLLDRQIPLCLSALKEHNRRNSLKYSNTSTPLPKKRFSNRISNQRAPSLSVLKRFARQGGPDLTDLRHTPPVTMPPRRATSSCRDSVKTKSTIEEDQTADTSRKSGITAYNPMLEVHFSKYNILLYREGDNFPPSNRDQIIRELTKKHPQGPAWSPSEAAEKHKIYKQHMKDPLLTHAGVQSLADKYLWNNDDHRILNGKDSSFENLATLTDETISKLRVDYFEGSSPSMLSQTVLDSIGTMIKPSYKSMTLVCPNLSMELKRPRSGHDVASRQASYAGSYGARAMQSLRTFRNPGDNDEYDNNAYTLAVIWDVYSFLICSIHVSRPPAGSEHPRYIAHELFERAMGSDCNHFQDAIHAFKNAQDWSAKQRENLIAAANTRAAIPLMTPVQSTIDQSTPVSPPQTENSTDKELDKQGATSTQEVSNSFTSVGSVNSGGSAVSQPVPEAIAPHVGQQAERNVRTSTNVKAPQSKRSTKRRGSRAASATREKANETQKKPRRRTLRSEENGSAVQEARS